MVFWALVQTFGINATKRSGTLRGSCGENCVPDFGQMGRFETQWLAAGKNLSALVDLVADGSTQRS